MKRATGIGGVFFKAKDPKALAAWYEKHLGLPFDGNTYAVIADEAGGKASFALFPEDTDHFKPSDKPFSLNFRVDDLQALVAVLKEEGVDVSDKIEEHPYGKFGWLIDPEGNRVELWEPVS